MCNVSEREEMLMLAEKLSTGPAFLRVDFYEVNGRVYFSEFTFYSDAGIERFKPDKWNKIVGDWITLPPKDKKK